jgi:hypothetical protein
MRAFSKVVDSCFSNTLLDTYITDILKFKKAYMDLGITVTPKVHL